MAMFLQRRVRVKYIGDDDYRPHNVPANKFIPAIGFETRRVEKTFEQGKTKTVDELFFIVVDNMGKPQSVAGFNCAVTVDENDDLSKTTDVLRNATLLITALSETMVKITDRMYPDEPNKSKNDKPTSEGGNSGNGKEPAENAA